MARNRVIYQSEALFVSRDAMATGQTGHEQLERVQSANYSFSIARQDVNQYGQLGKIGSMVLEAPTVSFDTSYLATDGFNERALGFYVGTGTGAVDADPADSPYIEKSFISGHLSDGSGRNLYVATVGEGLDNVDYHVSGEAGKSQNVIGIGNAYLTDYTLDLSVGSLPTVSASFEAANIRSTTGVSNMKTPAVSITGGDQAHDDIIVLPSGVTGHTDQIALRPGDITVSIRELQSDVLVDISGAGNTDQDGDTAHIQSASLSIPLSRTSLEKMGTKFSYAKAVDFPVQATLSISAIVNEMTARSLTDIINQESTHEVDLRLDTASGNNEISMNYKLKGAQVVSESISSSIGSNKSVDLTFVTSIGALNDTENGVFVSGRNTSGVYTAV